MKKTLTALSFISVALFSAAVAAGPGSTEYTYRNGDKIRVASPEAETSLFKDKSGKPVLVITSPDNRGISHNIFTDYNVGKKGLVIHNKENANTIINEVIGDNKTHLRGNTFVAGGKASLVIVNPNGVIVRIAAQPIPHSILTAKHCRWLSMLQKIMRSFLMSANRCMHQTSDRHQS